MKHTKDIFYGSSCQDINFDDYLLLGGGTDICSSLYGEKPSRFNQTPNKRRDTLNLNMIERAVEEKKPIFGICRGFQLMAAHFGGKLSQHASHPSAANLEFSTGEMKGPVRECHHQSVVDVGSDGKVLAVSNYGFTDQHTGKSYYRNLEIAYWPKYKALAVQFHPEWQWDVSEVNQWLNKFIETELGVKDVL